MFAVAAKPAASTGVTTAGNAYGVNDGAVEMFIGSRAVGEKAGIKPTARILAGAAVGVEPRVMGIGPAFAIPRALERARLTLDDIDVIEINGPFAAQVLGCLKLMNVAFDDPTVIPAAGRSPSVIHSGLPVPAWR